MGYFETACLTNCDKMQILKMGVPIFKGHLASINEQFVNIFTV